MKKCACGAPATRHQRCRDCACGLLIYGVAEPLQLMPYTLRELKIMCA